MGKDGGESGASGVTESMALSLGAVITDDGVVSKASIPFPTKNPGEDSDWPTLGHMLI